MELWGSRGKADGYTVAAGGGNTQGSTPVLQCRLCKTSVTMLSNHQIVEERDRLLLLGSPAKLGSCRKVGCPNAANDLSFHPAAYQRFGSTAIGSPRYRCRVCGSTFSTPVSPHHRLRRPEKTLEVFRCLINKVAMRRTCELADVGAETLYQRIGLIYERCRDFVARHEEPLLAGTLKRERMHVAVDRQEHVLNSATTLDARPSVLWSVASAEANTGYILAQHLNFDPDVDVFATELAAREAGDLDHYPAFRIFGRLWLPHERLENNAGQSEADPSMGAEYRSTSRGAHVHEGISLAAHFQVLERYTRGAAQLQITMDRESGIERICLLTFADRVRDGTMDAFLLRISKEHTQMQKRRALADAEAILKKERKRRPAISEIELLLDLIEKRFRHVRRYEPRPQDRWVHHPFPTMNEPDRALLCLTDNGDHSMEQLRLGFARASLRSVDRYFMQVRRKIHLLERPITSSSASFRRYFGYNAYSAVVVMRLLEIFRAVYNYHLVGQQTTTPAQRLGLIDHSCSLSELLGESE